MLAYVINLFRRPDRLSEMDAHLAERGISMKRIEAVDGKLWNGEGWKRQGKIREDHWRGSAGCYFSHILALETAIKDNVFPCIILEDDAELSETPVPEKGMVYLGGYESAAGIYGLHAVMYSDRCYAEAFLKYAKAHKNTIDSIANLYRKKNADVTKYSKGFIATQRRSFSDIEQETIIRTPDGKIKKV
jgi:hypothetical protein